MSRAKNWCFTLNNYGESDLSRLTELYDSQTEVDNGGPEIRYLVFQQEIGKEETPHLQGFLSLKGKKRLRWLKTMVSDRAHFEVAKGTPLQNRTYCTKTDTRKEGTTFLEFGELPGKKGERTDLAQFRDYIKENPRVTREQLLEDHPDICALYPRFVKECISVYTPVPEVEDHQLYPWQMKLTELLDSEPNDREIVFVIDEKGNSGKTWYAKKYCQERTDAQYMEPGKKADMAYTIETNKRTLFVNVTRQQVDHLQYSFLESVKDGMVFSPKYESGMKFLPKMHVVVLMNQHPDMSLLSDDRYHLMII